MNGPNVVRGAILAASCLVLGFVGGWSLANLGGKTIELPDARVDVTVATPTPSTSDAGTTSTTTAADPTAATVLVLNGSGIAGRAADTRTVLVGKGYTAVSVGNTDQVTETAVYYAADAAAAASAVAADLQIATTSPLVGSGIASAAGDADVVVVLGG